MADRDSRNRSVAEATPIHAMADFTEKCRMRVRVLMPVAAARSLQLVAA